jgi:hypothetical protein
MLLNSIKNTMHGHSGHLTIQLPAIRKTTTNDCILANMETISTDKLCTSSTNPRRKRIISANWKPFRTWHYCPSEVTRLQRPIRPPCSKPTSTLMQKQSYFKSASVSKHPLFLSVLFFKPVPTVFKNCLYFKDDPVESCLRPCWPSTQLGVYSSTLVQSRSLYFKTATNLNNLYFKLAFI